MWGFLFAEIPDVLFKIHASLNVCAGELVCWTVSRKNECKNEAGTHGGSDRRWFISPPWVNQMHTDTVRDLTGHDWKTCRNQVMEMVEEILSFIVLVLLMSLLCPFYPLSHPRLPEGKL